MTRRSPRELERALDELGGDADAADSVPIVYEHPETGAWYADAEMAGDPVDRDAVDPVMVLQQSTPAATEADT